MAALAVLLGVVGYLAYRTYQAEQTKAQSLATWRTEEVGRGDVVTLIRATGLILPEQRSNLVFLLPGTVREVLVTPGDQVRAGQVLARLEVLDLDLAVQQAEDALAVAQLERSKLLAGPTPGEIAVAQANVRSATAALGELTKGAPEAVAIAEIQYESLLANYQGAADQYNNSALDRTSTDPETQAALELLKLNMESAFYAAEIGRLQLEQAEQGADRGAVAVASARVAQANAALEQLLAPLADLQIQQADLAVTQARLALEQARLAAAQSALVAPIAGVVATVNVKAGDASENLVPAMVIYDQSQFHLDLAVDEIDVAQLSIGQRASVLVDGLPGITLQGQIDRIAPTANVAGGVVNYTVRVVLDPTSAELRTGMSATAEIVVAEATDVVRVPNWAIRRDRRTGEAFASLLVGEELREVLIVTGLRGEAYTQVTSGVRVGDVAAVSTAREQIDLFGGGG